MNKTKAKTGLAPILLVTFVASLGTGVQWGGISFIAKHHYGFDQNLNFVLFVVTALVYIAAAFGAGPLAKTLRPWISARSFLALLFLTQAATCTLPLFFEGVWVLWAVGSLTSVNTAILWPIIESYLTSGRYGKEMRRAMGWWNLCWTFAVALALFMMAPLLSLERSVFAIVALAPVFLACAMILPWFSSAPAEHEAALSRDSMTPEYPFLLNSARILLPVSYILIGTLSPLIPYRLEEVGAPLLAETPATATWMFGRFIAMGIMWRLPFWQGRWATLLVSGVFLTLGFAAVVLCPSLSLIIMGLLAFGAAQGVIYFAALYYAMSVGSASVESGGTHEALIGLGYAAGPLAALIGLNLPSIIDRGQIEPSTNPSGMVVAVALLTAVAAYPAVRPYRKALRNRTIKRCSAQDLAV